MAATTKPRSSEPQRIAEAYHMMAKHGYRPAAPGDGMGGIDLTCEQLNDPGLLANEANGYAERFVQEENTCSFFIGVSNYPNRELVYVVEAARLLCAGARELAAQLLTLAMNEVRKNIK